MKTKTSRKEIQINCDWLEQRQGQGQGQGRARHAKTGRIKRE